MAVTAPASAILSADVVVEILRGAVAVDFRFHAEIRSSLMILLTLCQCKLTNAVSLADVTEG